MELAPVAVDLEAADGGDVDAALDSAVSQLAEAFPCVGRSQLRAMLEAGGGVDAVLDQLLSGAGASAASSSSEPAPQRGPHPEGVAKLEQILPDCDPGHIRQVLLETGNDMNSALERILGAEAPYPRRPPKVPRGQGAGGGGASFDLTGRASDASSSASSSRGPQASAAAGRSAEAVNWFNSSGRKRRFQKHYREEAEQLLLDEFVEFCKPGVLKVFSQSDGAYAMAWKSCHEAMEKVSTGEEPPPPLRRINPRKGKAPIEKLNPKTLKSTVLREEFKFVRGYVQQKSAEVSWKIARELHIEECKVNGMLLECECCFQESLAEETIQCAAGHLFCKDCMQRRVESQLSGLGGALQLTCSSTCGCQEPLPSSELRRILPPALLEKYDKHLGKACVEAVILKGGLGQVERCPFCDFAMEMDLPPEENKIFVCQNEDCGIESCRLCKEKAHIPLKCSEIERAQVTEYRTTVEERMSEALIRECPACKKKGVLSRFVKADGCNRMTCPKCSSWVCYQCCALIDKQVGYGHFCQHPRDPGQKQCNRCNKCDLWSGTEEDLARAEQRRVAEAGLKADKDFRGAHEGLDVQDGLHVLREALDGTEEDTHPAKRRRQGGRA